MQLNSQSLMRMASGPLSNILSQLTQQLGIVEDQALNPIKMVVEQVVGGIWTGQGANAFVQEVASLMIPGVSQIGEQIGTFSSNLQFARDMIEQADEAVDRQVKSTLSDLFKFY